ncbi:MAG: hypothetical protein H6686_05555 [Fibrobacteria bacterium]|nr:hypothetical protein [Fibrobacteria bacterium]
MKRGLPDFSIGSHAATSEKSPPSSHTRRATGFAPLLAMASLLSGCFSMHLVDQIDRRDESSSWKAPALDWIPTELPVEIRGDRACAQRPIYRLNAASAPLYLDLSPGAELTDQLPLECDDVSTPQRLQLVVSDSPIPFHPTRSRNLVTALLILDIRDPGRGESRRVWHTGLDSRILYTFNSAVRDEKLSLHSLRNQVLVRPPRGNGRNDFKWLFLTIPLDVATSPIQLGLLVLASAAMLLFGLGAGK